MYDTYGLKLLNFHGCIPHQGWQSYLDTHVYMYVVKEVVLHMYLGREPSTMVDSHCKAIIEILFSHYILFFYS